MNKLELFRDITTFVFDVDGVLTDSNLFFFENGRIVRRLHERDLFALRQAVTKGFRVAIISGGPLNALQAIFHDLHIVDIYSKASDKKAVYDELKTVYNLRDEEILYMGDDLPDYLTMRLVGLPTCPANAVPEIKEIAQYQSPYRGGEGCVRDVVERVLKLNKKWNV